jgi:hypothetical protein
MGAIYIHNSSKAEVYSGTQKSRGDSESDEVYEEKVVLEGRNIKQDSGNVANNLKDLNLSAIANIEKIWEYALGPRA